MINKYNKPFLGEVKILLDDNINLNINGILECRYRIEEYFSNDIPKEYLIQLNDVANDGFGIQMLIEDLNNHIVKSNKIFILKINDKIIGFSSLHNLDDFIYRYGTVIRKDFQGQGLYKKLNSTIYEENKKYFVRTQNKNVVKSLEKSFDNVFYGKKALDFINNYISKDRINDFMLKLGDKEKNLDDNGIFKGAYGGKMGEKSRVDYIDENFYEGFDNDIGDSLLVVYFNN